MSQGKTPFETWMTYLKNEQPAVLATVTEVPANAALPVGGRLFMAEEGLSLGSLGKPSLDAEAAKVAAEKLNELYPKSETRSLVLSEGNKVNVFFDVNLPPTELLIFGAGHDAIPVASFAGQLGFRVTLVDQRPAYATEERFPDARIILARPEHLREKVQAGTRTFIIIMNHHIDKDRVCLSFALRSQVPYVGVLGPRKRRERLLNALREEGEHFTDEQLSRMYNPVGLDIGAETSEEVAVSILSEILAVRNGHGGGFLRERQTIHEPVRKGSI